jgi:hypothetical protein
MAAAPGALRFNTDSLKMELYDGNQWVEIVATSPEAQTGGARGVFGSGGTDPSPIFNVIDYVTISTTGNAQDFGDLLGAYTIRSSCSSSTRGLFAGGQNGPAPGYTNTIEYITISSTGNSQDFGDLTQVKTSLGSCSNSTRGIFGGGVLFSAPTTFQINVIEYVTISSIGNAIDFGDLSHTNANQVSALSSSTRGIFGGGAPNVNIIEFITISTTGNSADFGDLTVARHGHEGMSNSIRGLFAGGASPDNVIDYITIAALGNAIDFGDLTSARRNSCGTSSSTRAVIAGSDYPSTNVIDYVTIMTTGNAIDFGDRTGNYGGRCGLSNGHGGL